MLFSGSAVMFFSGKTAPLFLQLFGAGCLLVVVATHIFEALHLLPWMRWGDEHSVGHYLDLGSALLGLTLFPLGIFTSCGYKVKYRHDQRSPLPGRR
jgi:hypothetical protein